jgi:hypothetical protein
MERERKNELHRAFVGITRAVEDINGPYKQTAIALDLIQQAHDATLEDEVIGGCESCDELIWSGDTLRVRRRRLQDSRGLYRSLGARNRELGRRRALTGNGERAG